MKFLACFKIVPDLDMMPQGDWPLGESWTVDVQHVRTLWNCFDEGVLEMLLKLKDRIPATAISALTIGGPGCDPYLKTLYALGYEKAVRVAYGGDLRFVPELTARIVTAYAKKNGDIDALIMGSQSSEGNNGKTPMLTAEYLGWPCISQVLALDAMDETRLKVRSMSDQGEVV
jgi:electron transfer flavoprotein alpha/beta subunit